MGLAPWRSLSLGQIKSALPMELAPLYGEGVEDTTGFSLW